MSSITGKLVPVEEKSGDSTDIPHVIQAIEITPNITSEFRSITTLQKISNSCHFDSALIEARQSINGSFVFEPSPSRTLLIVLPRYFRRCLRRHRHLRHREQLGFVFVYEAPGPQELDFVICSLCLESSPRWRTQWGAMTLPQYFSFIL